MTKVQDPGHPRHPLSPRVTVVTWLSIGLNAKKNVFLAGWSCERGRKLNEVLSHWMKSEHKLQFRVSVFTLITLEILYNKSANLLRIIIDKDQAKDLRCLVLQEILVIWLGTTLKSYNKGQWKIAVKMLQLPLQCRYKNSKNKGARKTLMALQTNAWMQSLTILLYLLT